MAKFKVKGVIDKKKNRVLFIESDADLVDVLFSFLTMPLGAIIRLTRNLPPPVGIGCLTNLYGSVESLDEKQFRTKICKTMLLQPRNGAEDQFKELKLHIEDVTSYWWYYCGYSDCYKVISRYSGPSCRCGRPMKCSTDPQSASKSEASYAQDEGVFVQGLTRHVITDELEVLPLSTAASFSLLSKLGVRDDSAIEERTYDIGVNEVLILLKSSLVSTYPLTKTLLKPEAEPQLSKECYDHQGSFTEHETNLLSAEGDGKICIRLLVSKSKKMVCYADVGEDFVDLLLGFLTIPLGHVMKEMDDVSPSKGCAHHLYKSVHQLDALKYLKSNERKEILLNPKIAPGFGFERQLIGVEEALEKKYYYARWMDGYNRSLLTADKSLFPSKAGLQISEVTVMDPKSPLEGAANGGGYLRGPSSFTVSDDLIIRPLSLVSGLSILKKLGVPLRDIEEHVVHVGEEEASRILVASLISESALTNAFIRKKPEVKQQWY